MQVLNLESANRTLEQVSDPEIPVLTIADLGIIRDVKTEGRWVEVTITPTYSGCPAMDTIEADIRTALKEAGWDEVKVKTVLDPPWTTDWMSIDGRRKLEEYGIAAPMDGTADKRILFGKAVEVRCPRCKSIHTQRISQFGSTPCKALYQCSSCLEPFDYFKCI